MKNIKNYLYLMAHPDIVEHVWDSDKSYEGWRWYRTQFYVMFRYGVKAVKIGNDLKFFSPQTGHYGEIRFVKR